MSSGIEDRARAFAKRNGWLATDVTSAIAAKLAADFARQEVAETGRLLADARDALRVLADTFAAERRTWLSSNYAAGHAAGVREEAERIRALPIDD